MDLRVNLHALPCQVYRASESPHLAHLLQLMKHQNGNGMKNIFTQNW